MALSKKKTAPTRCCLWREPVFRIHEILVWIRIRGSMPLNNGSGSCNFRHWPLWRYIYIIFQRLEVRNKSSVPDPYLWLMDPDPGGPKTRGSGSGTMGRAVSEEVHMRDLQSTCPPRSGSAGSCPASTSSTTSSRIYPRRLASSPSSASSGSGKPFPLSLF